jgi:hypothetical protein
LERIIAFDDHGNWLDVSGGVTLMTVSQTDYEDAIEELKWRHPQGGRSPRHAIPISTAEQFDQDGEVSEFVALDYVSQTEYKFKRV